MRCWPTIYKLTRRKRYTRVCIKCSWSLQWFCLQWTAPLVTSYRHPLPLFLIHHHTEQHRASRIVFLLFFSLILYSFLIKVTHNLPKRGKAVLVLFKLFRFLLTLTRFGMSDQKPRLGMTSIPVAPIRNFFVQMPRTR